MPFDRKEPLTSRAAHLEDSISLILGELKYIQAHRADSIGSKHKSLQRAIAAVIKARSELCNFHAQLRQDRRQHRNQSADFYGDLNKLGPLKIKD